MGQQPHFISGDPRNHPYGDPRTQAGYPQPQNSPIYGAPQPAQNLTPHPGRQEVSSLYGPLPEPYQPVPSAYGPHITAYRDHPNTQLVFILGVVGIFANVLSLVAWYLGAQARKEIRAGAPYHWEGKLKAGYLVGKVIGILSTLGWGLVVLLFILVAVSS